MKTFKKWGRSTNLIAVDWMLPGVEERRILKMDRKVKRKKFRGARIYHMYN